MVLLLIILLFIPMGYFFWTIRKTFWLNPAFYFVIFTYFIPFVIVAFLDHYTGIQLVFYNRLPYSLSEKAYLICLSLTLLSFICFFMGYLWYTKNKIPISKRLSFNQYVSFERIHPILVTLFIVAGLAWLFGIQLSYGLSYYLNYFAQIRGNPNFEMSSNSAFLIHFGRNITMIIMLFWIGNYALNRNHGFFALISLFLMVVMLFTAGGRAGFIYGIYFIVMAWNGAKRNRPSKFAIIVLIVAGFVFVVAGRTILNLQSYTSGFKEYGNTIFLQLSDIEHSFERLSYFGLDLLHLFFVAEDVGDRYEYFFFRDIPLIPLYIIPKMMHGMDFMTAHVVFNDIYYPIRYGNNPPTFLAYLYWSLGLPGVIFGSFVVGYLAGFVKKWTIHTASIPSFYGVAVLIAFNFSNLKVGYMSGIAKSLFPYFFVIVLLLVISKVRLTFRRTQILTLRNRH
jgi:oligosaccharide repeat unit polymerase